MTNGRDDRDDRARRDGPGVGAQAAALAAASTEVMRGLTHATAGDLGPEDIGSTLAGLGATAGELPALLERLDATLAVHLHGSELVVTGGDYHDDPFAAVSAVGRARDSLDLAASVAELLADCLVDASEALAHVTIGG
jgi:hypothetical protein